MLAKLQQDFLRDIFQGSSTIETSLASPIERLNIYQNNVLLGMTNVLQNIFPATQQIVGEHYFQQLAQKYIKQSPQTLGHSNSVGQGFAAFLKQDSTDLPYLGDIATLEYAYADAGTAKDALAIGFEKLSFLTAADTLHLHPSAHLLILEHNALEIWQAHQQSPVPEISLTTGKNHLLVWRNQKDIIMMLPVDAITLIFLKKVMLQSPFLTALQTTLQQTTEPQLFQQLFAHIINNGVFTTQEKL